jgi:hypothetical protein
MCSAPTCHVTNVRPSIDSPHIAVILRNTPDYQCLWFQFYRASNFYCMVKAADSLLPTGPPSATDWVAAGVAAALETSVTTAAAVTAAVVDSIITAAADSTITAAADAAAVNVADAAVAALLATTAGNSDDDAITTSKQASVISSSLKISLDKRQCGDNQPDKRHERGHWQQKQQQLQLCNNQQNRNGTKTHSSSHRKVAARRLAWRRWLCNCRGGGNDDYDAEMMTMMMTTAAASIGSIVGLDAAALLHQWLTTRGKCSQRQC